MLLLLAKLSFDHCAAAILSCTTPHNNRSTAPSAFTGYAFHVVEALIVFANEVIVCFLFPLHMGLHRLYHILTTVIHEGTDGCVHAQPAATAATSCSSGSNQQPPHREGRQHTQHVHTHIHMASRYYMLLPLLLPTLSLYPCTHHQQKQPPPTPSPTPPPAGHVGYELSPFIPTLEGVWALLTCGLRGSASLNTVQHHDMHHRFPTKHFSLYFTHWDRWMGTLHPKYEANLFRYFGSGSSSSSAHSSSSKSSS